MRFGVLGPLEVHAADGTPVRVVERKVRQVLAVLLADAGRPVSVDRLVDALWPDHAPGTPVRAVQAKVAQLRRALDDAEPGARALVESRAPGYLLRADPDTGAELDADRFTALTARARRTGSPPDRAALLTGALALWRGPAFADFADEDFAHAAITRLDEERLTALEDLADTRLALGRHTDVLTDLADLVTRHPLRERLRAAHIRALYLAGRQAEALSAYDDVRRRLADELGVDPNPALTALHHAILTQDPALAAVPSVRAGAAAARTPDLPVPATPLVGRDDLVADVGRHLATDRLVTLTGPGGVGKTRLALEVARRADFPDGVHLADLTGPRAPLDVVAGVLGVRDDGTWGLDPVPLADRVAHALRDRRLLLVLDNCEHVVAQVAELARHLLGAAPDLRVLATSREPLAIAGERLWPVPPLPDVDAARLFTDRATAVAPGVPLDPDAVAALCRRLDGLPLALELAATKVRALGVRGVLERLDDRFRLLSGGYRDLPPRQRTLRAVVDWSWELLDDTERRVLRRLAVHADGCTWEAAEHVSAVEDVLEPLTRLVDRSLVVVGDGPRYRLLESVAAYCVERMAEAGEWDEVRRRHLEHYTALAGRARLHGPEQGRWLDLLDAEAANLHAALDHAVRTDADEAGRLADVLVWHWVLRGRLGEASRALEPVRSASARAWRTGIAVLTGDGADRARRVADALAHDPGTRPRWFLGHALCAIGDLDAGEALIAAALRDFRAEGDRWGEAAALADRATVMLLRGDLDAVARDGGRSAGIFTELGDRWGLLRTVPPLAARAEAFGDYDQAEIRLRDGLLMARGLGLCTQVADLTAGLGRIALLRGDHDTARGLHEEARRLAATGGFRAGEVNAVLGLGLGARRSGDLDTAEQHLRAVLHWHRQVGLDRANALVLAELGFIAEHRHDAERALHLHRQGLAVARHTADPRALALALEGLAGAHALAGRSDTAAVLLGAADTARRSRGAPLPAAERGDVDRITATARAALGTAAFAERFAHGTTLDPAEAVTR